MARKGLYTKTLTLPNGKRKYVSAKTQEELEQKVFQLRLQMRMGVDISDRTTVGEMIQIWFTTEVEPKVSPETAKNLKGTINKHVLPYISAAELKEVKPIHIQQILARVADMNRQTKQIVMRTLRDTFAMAEENGLILRSPVLQRFKAGGFTAEEKQALTPHEEEQLLIATQDKPMLQLFIWTALATGLRRGELCGLLWDCVDLETGVVHVRRNLVMESRGHNTVLKDHPKTFAGFRTVSIPEDLKLRLKQHRRDTSSVHVFTDASGQPFNAVSFQTMWYGTVSRFGPKAIPRLHPHAVVTDTNVTPHILRHTFATRCFEAGLDIKEVQYLMGHATPEVTLKIYTHYCEECRKENTLNKARDARKRTTLVPHSAVYLG